MNTAKEIENIIAEYTQEISNLRRELYTTNGGKLYVRKQNNRYYYHEISHNYKKSITRNKPRVYRLARKGYLRKLLAVRIQELDELKGLHSKLLALEANSSTERYLARFPELDPYKITTPQDQLQWEAYDYMQCPVNPDELRYQTTMGVYMRSKSERYIGSFLEENNIAYRYEAQLSVFNKTYYPDFTLRRRDGKIIIWEHFGLDGNPSYDNRTFVKLSDYREIGFTQNDNLICTYEEDIEDPDTLKRILRRYMML